jgi:glutaredoxin
MALLLSSVFRSRARATHLTITVYTRARCCCCHKAIDLLKHYQGRYGFRLEEVDIDDDPELSAKYNTEVPVVALGGKVRFRGVMNRALLERLLVAESRLGENHERGKEGS